MKVIKKPIPMRVITKSVPQKERSLFPRFKMYVFFALCSFLAITPLASTNADYTIQKKGRGVNFESACWSAPSVPVLKSPANEMIADSTSTWLNNPQLVWNPSEMGCPDAQMSYDVEIYQDPELTNLIDTNTVINTSYLSQLSSDGIYYWRVRAKDQDGHVSDFSEPWRVSISRSTLSAPQISGWNLQSKSSEAGKSPVDLVCGDITSGGKAEHITIAPQWSVVQGTGVLYQLEFTQPNGNTLNKYYTQLNSTFEDIGSYPDIQGTWKIRMRSMVDSDGNGIYTDGELSSGWGNECNLTFDKEAPDVPAIVMNEIFPSPSTEDNASKPNGEWVELYNRSGSSVDVSGWVLYDSNNNHELAISSENSDNNSNPFDQGETVVPAHGYLVVYRNGDSDFDLDNGGDTVRLYSGSLHNSPLKDSYTYVATPTDKSIARIDDGANNWVDPIVTPVRKNIVHQADLRPATSVDQQDTHRLQLSIVDAINYQIAKITVHYLRKQDEELVQEEFSKEISIDKNDLFIRDLFLGTVSSDTEYPHYGIEQINGEIVLIGQNIPDRTVQFSFDKPWSEPHEK